MTVGTTREPRIPQDRVKRDGPRVGVLLWDDEQDPAALSGMPWNMREGLARAGCEVVPILVGRYGGSPIMKAGRLTCRWKSGRRLRTDARRFVENMWPAATRRQEERKARNAAAAADRGARDLGVAGIFAPVMKHPLAFYEGDRPVVYASDATASLLASTYQLGRQRGAGWSEATFELETRALARADRVALASDRTARSAVEDHHADPAKISVVPFGANIWPDTELQTIDAPGTDDLRLLLSAADPERKQLGLCIEIVGELRTRGWNATLHYIGPEREACRRSEVVWAGRLRLGDPTDAAIHRDLLRTCHLAILPSLAEMYGIAPVESAAFGRPAVVSDAGGLPTVVRQGETGLVVPIDTPVAGWADAVEAICARPDRYAAFSRAARLRQESVLNWDAWGRTVRGLIEQVV